MCYCRCKYESEFTGECTLKSIDCKAERENRIEEIKEEIAKHESEIVELEKELEELEV